MLTKVTITGADDNTNLEDLLRLSRAFPFVEWGILVSLNSEGSSRFPSRKWIEEFSAWAKTYKWNVSTHVCGTWVRQMLVGELNWMDLPDVIHITQRIQINTHAQPHTSTTGLIRSLSEARAIAINELGFIFQWDGINDHLIYAPLAYGLKVSALFDTSHGAGKLPGSWQKPAKEFPCGYAGGLGPENITEQLLLIEKAAGKKDYWVDMEGRVRTDGNLDASKVEKVLQACYKHRAAILGPIENT